MFYLFPFGKLTVRPCKRHVFGGNLVSNFQPLSSRVYVIFLEGSICVHTTKTQLYYTYKYYTYVYIYIFKVVPHS